MATLILILVLWILAQSGIPNRAEAGRRQEVSATLTEWEIKVDKKIAQTGKVTFKAANKGTKMHEVVILKTDLPVDALEVVNGRVNEKTAGTVIGEIEGFVPGGKEEMAFDLPKGRYVLFCNLLEANEGKGHYQNGMRVSFTVGTAPSSPLIH
jgi:uncharacterized cupredoxin-like copper-binding protein